MGKPLLDFRFLLIFIAWAHGDGEFDSRTLAEELRALLWLAIMRRPEIEDRIRPKLISNDLRRLYSMGFLRRRKVKRECQNKRGKKYNCGYKYMYQINNQGQSYVRLLITHEGQIPHPLGDSIMELGEEVNGELILARIMNAVEKFEKGNAMWTKVILDNVQEEVEEALKGKGYQRFTLKPILYKERLQWWMMIAELQNEIQRLKEELRQKNNYILELEWKLMEAGK